MGAVRQYDGLFKAYDIRGVYSKELDTKFAYKLGKAFVHFTKTKEVAVGYDGRTSSKKLFEALTKGILEQGADIIDIGQISTPGCYYSLLTGKYQNAIMITASHLPKQYNGFKLMSKGGSPIFLSNGGSEIMDIIHENEYPKPKKKGKKKKKSWMKEYKKYLSSTLLKNKTVKSQLKKLKIVIDQSNGTGYVETDVLKEAMPKAKVINTRISGTFPGHDPDPLHPQSRKKLGIEVKNTKASFGIIYDGDADRVCFVDEKGQFIRPDILLNIMVKDYKSGKIIYDTRSSKAVAEIAKKQGLHPIMSKSGRSYIIEAMKNEQAELGGEGSGHYYFKELKGLDCGGLAAIKVILRYLADNTKKEKNMSEIVQENNPYFHSGEVNFKVKNPSKAFLIIEQGFREAQKTLFIDGLSVYYEDFWFNVRKSNTEPLIRINAESDTKEGLDKIMKSLNKVMALSK